MFYIYDEDTKEFLGTTQGQKNPRNKIDFLQPAHTTTLAPPTEYSVNEVPVFSLNLGVWKLTTSQYKLDLDTSTLKETNGYGVLLNEGELGAVVPRSTEEIDAETDAIIAAEVSTDLAEEKEILRSTMDTNIVVKAVEITGGTNLDSIQAFLQAFNLRAFSPDSYVDAGLVVFYAIDGYTKGSALDTSEKIKDYYTKILVEVDIFRNNEISNYLAALALL
jgi:hypothetical protein